MWRLLMIPTQCGSQVGATKWARQALLHEALSGWDPGGSIPSLKLTANAPENRSSQKETIVFQPSIFRCENVSFRECMAKCLKSWNIELHWTSWKIEKQSKEHSRIHERGAMKCADRSQRYVASKTAKKTKMLQRVKQKNTFAFAGSKMKR